MNNVQLKCGASTKKLLGRCRCRQKDHLKSAFQAIHSKEVNQIKQGLNIVQWWVSKWECWITGFCINRELLEHMTTLSIVSCSKINMVLRKLYLFTYSAESIVRNLLMLVHYTQIITINGPSQLFIWEYKMTKSRHQVCNITICLKNSTMDKETNTAQLDI
jgi:hypothetical protein